MKFIETDYLIIGAGAMALAFADEIFTLNKTTNLVLLDRRARFGGHWLDAYDYVHLHQPAAFYGVNSLKLEKEGTDLSSKKEILAYYNKIYEKFIASGRVQFFGQYNYNDNFTATSLSEPTNTIDFKVNQKVVDARYMNVEIPATHAPKFSVSPQVNLVPLNDLIHQYKLAKEFYVIGNGKTGIDAVLFLLEKGISPNNIYWIAPNDAWFFNRDQVQIGDITKELLTHGDYMKTANKADDIFFAKEKTGGIFRLDKRVLPKKWRCATISEAELHNLRKIKNMIRKGRIKSITPTLIQFQNEDITYAKEDVLFVNCSADGLAKKPSIPIFNGKHITLQPVVFCQTVFSSAIAAKLELSNLSDTQRNKVQPIPHPEVKEDWVQVFSATIDNLLILNKYFPIWMYSARLNLMAHESLLKYLYYASKALFLAKPLKQAVKRMPRKIQSKPVINLR